LEALQEVARGALVNTGIKPQRGKYAKVAMASSEGGAGGKVENILEESARPGGWGEGIF